MNQLKVGHFNFSNKPTKIMIGALLTKTRAPRVTFITEEATNALKDYLGDRINDPNSPIFLLPDGRPTTEHALRKQIMRAIDNAGLKKKRPESYTNEIHVHCFRKFFKTRLTNAQMPDAIIETLLGHLNQNDRSYLRTTEEELGEAYVKFGEPALTIFSREPKELGEKLEWLKQDHDREIEKLRETAEKNKQLTEQAQRQEEEIATLKKKLEQIAAVDEKRRHERQERVEWMEKELLAMKQTMVELQELLEKQHLQAA